MKKMFFLVLCLLALSCAGCKNKDNGSRIIVRQIQVSMPQGLGMVHKDFTHTEALQHILGAIRLLGQEFHPAVDPETLAQPTTRIEMTHTDGSTHTVVTKGDRYIRRDNGPWREVDPENLARLHGLLHQLPAQA